jgi:PAS domain S-box-containing protein
MTWTQDKSISEDNSRQAGTTAAQEIERLATELTLNRIEMFQCKRELKQVEQELQAYRCKYQNILDEIPFGFLTLDISGIILEANHSIKRTLGMVGLGLTGQSIFSLVVPDHREKLYSCLRQIIKTGNTQFCDVDFTRKDGSITHSRMSLSLLKNSGSRRGFYQVVVLNNLGRAVSDDEEVKKSTVTIPLSQSSLANGYDNQFKSLLDNMLDGCVFFRIVEDESGGLGDLEYLDVNCAFEKLTGLKRENIIGKRVSEVMPSIKKLNAGLLESYRSVTDSGKLAFLEVFLESLKIWLKIIAYSPQKGFFVSIFEDFTERKNMEKALLESEEKFRSLMKLSPIPMSFANEKGEIEFVNDQFVSSFGYTREDIPTLEEWALKAFPDEKERQGLNSIWEKAVEYNRSDNAELQPPELRITCKDGSVRIVELSGKKIGNKDLAVFRDITQRRSGEEELRKSVNKVQKALQGFVQATIKMVEMRDPYTANHQQRVSQLVAAIAREMNFPEEQVEYIGIAGMVHDIGKIYVPTDILSRTGLLNEFEWEIMKTHVQGSYDILKNIEFPWPIAQIALQHHERLNGSGYPHALKGNEIKMEARILAVADSIEAISSHRPYRPARPIAEALKIIYENQGTLYDHEVVKACIRLFNEKGFTFIGSR